MSNWSCGINVHDLPIMCRIHDAGDKRAGHDLLRECIFLRLLSYSANDANFSSTETFAKAVGVPQKQAELVWELCLSSHVLRKFGAGYSAKDWMKENNLLKTQRLQQEYNLEPNESKDDKTEETENIIKVDTQKPYQQSYLEDPCNRKQALRHNVYLSGREMESLKDQYSDDEVNKMLDILSDYKAKNNRQYSSDYEAINRWVVKRFAKDKKSPSIQTTEFPAWVYGG